MTVTAADVRRAAAELGGVARRTPVDYSATLTRRAGVPVWLKAENLQRTGSFKVRGAYVRIARLSPAEKARGVVAASAGNHAQGVALAAHQLGIRARIYMPADAALPKVAATRGYGADVELVAGTLTDALEAAARAAAEPGGPVLIHPFDHPDVVAGQGTVALEILEQVPDVRTILVPTGGGGLLAGVLAAVHEDHPDVAVVGVQAAGAAAYPGSLAAGRPVALDAMSTMADGIAVGRPGDVPFDVIRGRVREIRAVSEEQISRAVLLLAERAKLVVEPSGAAGVAALLDSPDAFEGPVVALLSGGNVDPLVLMRLVQHGMAAAGRYLQLRVRLTDAPGSLAALLGRLAQVGANVVRVEHSRTGVHLAVGEVEVLLEAEARGPEHCAEVLEHLTAAGYPVARG